MRSILYLLPAPLRNPDLRPRRLHDPVALAGLQRAELQGRAAVADEDEFAPRVEGVGPGLARADGELGAGAAVDQEGAVGDPFGLGVGDREQRLVGLCGAGGERRQERGGGEGREDRQAGRHGGGSPELELGEASGPGRRGVKTSGRCSATSGR